MSEIASTAGEIPVPVIARGVLCTVMLSLYPIAIVALATTAKVGAKVTTNVQVPAAASDPPFTHVPPVPGKVPPLNVYGAASPEPAKAVAGTPPVLVTM